MAGFYGADTEQLRDHAQLVGQRAQRIIELRDQLTPLVMNEGMWQGADADAFRDRWSGEIAGQFDQRNSELTARQSDLEQHADEQDTASGEGGGSGDGSGGDKKGVPWWDLYKKYDSFMKKMRDLKKFLDMAGDNMAAFIKFMRNPSIDAFKDMQKVFGEGIDEILKHGKGWSEMARKALNKLGVPYSLLDEFKKPMGLLNKLNDVAPFMSKLGNLGGRLLPGVDIVFGGMQVWDAYKKGDTFSMVTGGASMLSGALLLAAPFTGPAAPFVAGAGAIIGAGAALADLGKLAWDNREAIGNAIGSGIDAIGNAGAAAGEAIGSGLEAAGDAIGDAAGAAGDFIGGLF